MVTWSECAADFEGDGSLRDIYVLEGGIAAWEALLRVARARNARFSLDGVAKPLPETARDAFAARKNVAAVLLINWNGIELAAHFFDQLDVELDFVPNTIRGEEELETLCSFLGELARATGKDVIVTPENLRSSPILRGRPTGEISYEAPQGAV
jgi:hypothetical protein